MRRSDWRLPTREELRSIVDYSRDNTAIDTAWFSSSVNSWSWSSSPYAGSAGSVWVVHIYDGHFGHYSTQSDGVVRLVRGGDASPPPTAFLGPSGGPSNPSGEKGEPVNTATGNYYYQHTDLTLPGRGLGLAFIRTTTPRTPRLAPSGAAGPTVIRSV